MEIPYIVFLVTVLVWLIPPFKQYKTRYFYFFLILALMDPISFVIMKSFHIVPQAISPVIAVLLIYSLIKNEYKNALIIIAVMLLLIVIELILKNDLLSLLNSIIHLMILGIIIINFLKYILEKNAVSIFFIFLISYELSSILKNIVYATDIMEGIVLFYITTFFQIFFGIIFSFVNINTKVFPISKKIPSD